MPEPKINTGQMKKQLFRFLTEKRGVAPKSAKMLVTCVFTEVEKGKRAKKILESMGFDLTNLLAQAEAEFSEPHVDAWSVGATRGIVLQFRRS